MQRDISLDSRKAKAREAERWQRLVVKCRWNQEVPIPVIKFICPMTQAASPNDDTPGFLVVLDESWYRDSLGGLADKFEADIVRVALPDDPSESRYEFGPDPVIDMREDVFIGSRIELPELVGAIGYTFDTDTSAPLFVQSSFVVPAPRIDGQVADLWWHFNKVRFRRSFDPDGLAGSQAAPATQSKW